jgi:hypothetical protein
VLQQLSISYHLLRRYRDEEAVLDRALAVDPNDIQTKAARAYMELDWKADTQPLHQLIDEIRAKDTAAVQSVSESWLLCALAERDTAAVENALIATGENTR